MLLLATLNDEINLIINEFWKGQNKGEREMHMMKWERLHESKQQRRIKLVHSVKIL